MFYSASEQGFVYLYLSTQLFILNMAMEILLKHLPNERPPVDCSCFIGDPGKRCTLQQRAFVQVAFNKYHGIWNRYIHLLKERQGPVGSLVLSVFVAFEHNAVTSAGIWGWRHDAPALPAVVTLAVARQGVWKEAVLSHPFVDFFWFGHEQGIKFPWIGEVVFPNVGQICNFLAKITSRPSSCNLETEPHTWTKFTLNLY